MYGNCKNCIRSTPIILENINFMYVWDCTDFTCNLLYHDSTIHIGIKSISQHMGMYYDAKFMDNQFNQSISQSVSQY